MSDPHVLRFGAVSLRPEHDSRDPRGILWQWEKPSLKETYIVGVDPTVGIPGWSRAGRTIDDHLRDNAAIAVFRVRHDEPDLQVAELAAPYAPLTLAPILNMIGRLYAGRSDSGEAKMIVEVLPGPGLAVMQELVHKYGYTNFWFWQHPDKFTPTSTPYPGWYATSRVAQQLLWTKGHHYINSGGVIIKSPWLADEMTDCVFDAAKGRGTASWRKHDDRVYAMLMALYAAHDWATMEIPEMPQPEKDTSKTIDYASMPVSVERMWEMANDRFAEVLDEGEWTI